MDEKGTGRDVATLITGCNSMKKMLLIKQCSLHYAWYKDKIDMVVPYINRPSWEADGYYCSVEDGGHTNVVLMEDASVVEV